MKKVKRPELMKTIRRKCGITIPKNQKTRDYFSRQELLEINAHLITEESDNVQNARIHKEGKNK